MTNTVSTASIIRAIREGSWIQASTGVKQLAERAGNGDTLAAEWIALYAPWQVTR
jgi:phosphoserine aminotransferase